MQVVYAMRRTYIVISFLYKGRFTGLLRQWRTRSTHKQREGNMNTIQVTTAEGTVNYTEAEVLHFMARSKELNVYAEDIDSKRKELRELRNNVRDFFSEVEWEDGEQTVNKREVNDLLERIGAAKLTSKYTGTFTITGTFSVEVEDEDEINSIIEENTDISNWSADMDIEQVEVHDVEEER